VEPAGAPDERATITIGAERRAATKTAVKVFLVRMFLHLLLPAPMLLLSIEAPWPGKGVLAASLCILMLPPG